MSDLKSYEIRRISHHDTITVKAKSLLDAFESLSDEYGLRISYSASADGGRLYHAWNSEYEFIGEETVKESCDANQTM